jgi:GNAT superfamily N-acetyltransferase
VVAARFPDLLVTALGVDEVAPPDAAPEPEVEDVEVRLVGDDDLPLLAEIEERAATVFRVAGFQLPALDAPDYTTVTARAILVIGDPPVGFARLDEVGGLAHLEELDVLPGSMRAGLGTRLVDAACDWAREHGYPAITLITFRDVAWNGPFYAKRGFVETTEVSPGLAALRDHERDIGLDEVGTRVVMRREL